MKRDHAFIVTCSRTERKGTAGSPGVRYSEPLGFLGFVDIFFQIPPPTGIGSLTGSSHSWIAGLSSEKTSIRNSGGE
jgi:hypothetical protein